MTGCRHKEFHTRFRVTNWSFLKSYVFVFTKEVKDYYLPLIKVSKSAEMCWFWMIHSIVLSHFKT